MSFLVCTTNVVVFASPFVDKKWHVLAYVFFGEYRKGEGNDVQPKRRKKM